MRRLLSLCAALLMSGMLLTACYVGNPSGPKVGIVGDSITWYSATDLTNTLGPWYDVDISGEPGYTIGEQLPQIERMISSDSPPPQDWVINLGTNDAIQAGYGNFETGWQADFNQEIALTNYAACVVLFTINLNADHFEGGSGDVAEELNTQIEALADLEPWHFRVIDWNDLVASDPFWMMPDGIHPNVIGQQDLSDWVALALQSCP
jgi:hypothetical protein